MYFDDGTKQADTGANWLKWGAVFLCIWLMLSLCSSPQETKPYTVYLTEPMQVDMVAVDQKVTVIHIEKYQWINYGTLLQIEMLGRIILIPTNKIKFIEVTNNLTNSNAQRR